MSDLEFRDTPALEVLRTNSSSLGHIDPESIAAAQDLLRLSKRLLGSFAERFALHGLSPGRYALLMALFSSANGLAPSEIAERLGVTRATVTGLIVGLARDDLVAYGATDTPDRRRKAIALTGKGRDLLGVVVPDIFAGMADLLAPLSAAERATLLRLAHKLEVGLMEGERS